MVRLDGQKIHVSMLRVGFDADGAWRLFSLRLLLANAAMAGVVLSLHGSMAQWLSWGLVERVQQLGLIVIAAALTYVTVLLLSGLRPRHLRRSAAV